jgi:hypothetical protein
MIHGHEDSGVRDGIPTDAEGVALGCSVGFALTPFLLWGCRGSGGGSKASDPTTSIRVVFPGRYASLLPDDTSERGSKLSRTAQLALATLLDTFRDFTQCAWPMP